MSINISIADLEAVQAVHRHLSFRGAAEELCITQPSVSSRVRHVEEVLGVALFHRTTRKVLATEHGERLCAYADRALSDLGRLSREFRDESKLKVGKIVLGATPTLAATVATDVICKFSIRYPNIEITLLDDFFGRSLSRLMTGEADFALTPSISAPDWLSLEEIGSEEVVLVAPRSHHLVQRPTVQLRDTAEDAMVLVSSQTALSQLIFAAYSKAEVTQPKVSVTQNVLTAVALMRSTGRFTFLPKGVLSLLDLSSFGIASLSPQPLRRPICLAVANDRALQPASAALMEAFRETFRSPTPAPRQRG
jgi:DNA-binding transcriptional LysR family regulator